jgi:hypothetical protein
MVRPSREMSLTGVGVFQSKAAPIVSGVADSTSAWYAS